MSTEPTRTTALRIVDRFRHHEDWEVLTLEISHALEDAHKAGHEVPVPSIIEPLFVCQKCNQRKYDGDCAEDGCPLRLR